MLSPNQDVFINFPTPHAGRVLHAARVVEREGEVLGLAFDRDVPPVRGVSPDDAASRAARGDGACEVFFQGPREFMKHSAVLVDPGSASPEGCDIAVRLRGEPVSAESREAFRVGTVLSDYSGEFDGLGVCPIVDVSATGLAFIAKRALGIGDAVAFSFEVGGERYAGRGVVQSCKPVRAGHRHGLLCVSTGTAPGCLSKGLQRLTMEAQRLQLRRLSGAA